MHTRYFKGTEMVCDSAIHSQGGGVKGGGHGAACIRECECGRLNPRCGM